MLADVVFICDFLQIIEQFRALAEIAGPGVSRPEGVGIGMVRRVDAAAGIAVDVPGAAEFGVLLDNGVADAEMSEGHGKRDGADAGTDDQDMMMREGLVRWALGPARLPGNKAHFLPHQRGVFGSDVFAEAGAHHSQDHFVAGIGDDRLWGTLREQPYDRGADFMLDFRGQSGIGIGDQAYVAFGLVGWLQPALVAGHMHQHHQEAANVRLSDSGGEIELSARQVDIHDGLISSNPTAMALRAACHSLLRPHRVASSSARNTRLSTLPDGFRGKLSRITSSSAP